jgi:deoxyguanosine kinase
MKPQHQIIVSLGSNQGNRQEHIENAIDCIHNSIGTVIRVSKLYQTPSWGFEGDAFYNCALMLHANLSATEILSKILNLEKKLGRIRDPKLGYQSRVIDIDLIAFDSEIIHLENLVVPHPQLQNRNFVLIPMQDLNLNWKHPIFNKTISELIAISPDKSSCECVQNLKNPLSNIAIKKQHYIAIEGNIGAGKTSLTRKIANDFETQIILERFADNPFLPKFYEDQNRYAFSLEMAFLADRHQQLSDDLTPFDLQNEVVISDYYIFKSLIFAKITLSEDEYILYKKLFDIVFVAIPKPDLYVYLHQNTTRLLENIKKRGRDYEQNISQEYLNKINLGYLDFIKNQTELNVLVIDVSELDFINNQEDYIFILDEIEKKINKL